MSELSELIGKRLRHYRLKQKLTQENVAELAGCHPTYIGQVERGEKNVTIENIYKIASAVSVSLSELFSNIELNQETNDDNIPLICYDYLLCKTKAEQNQLFNIILEIDKYKNL